MMGTQITQEVEQVLYTPPGSRWASRRRRPSPPRYAPLPPGPEARGGRGTRLPGGVGVPQACGGRVIAGQDRGDLDGRPSHREIAHALTLDAPFFLYLGAASGFPVALEGALKLKEISYIHAEGYAAGEMKHGPIALLDPRMPIVALVPRGPHVYDKILSNIQEVRARGARSSRIATEGNDEIQRHPTTSSVSPDAPSAAALLTVIPLQLLAYHVAGAGRTSISRATWPRPSRSSSPRPPPDPRLARHQGRAHEPCRALSSRPAASASAPRVGGVLGSTSCAGDDSARHDHAAVHGHNGCNDHAVSDDHGGRSAALGQAARRVRLGRRLRVPQVYIGGKAPSHSRSTRAPHTRSSTSTSSADSD